MFWHVPTSLTSVLGLSRMELTFFIEALTVLCFGSVAKTVLIIHQCFGHC